MFGRAFFLFCIGLFKKAVISDYISLNFVDRIFDTPDKYSGLLNLSGVYGYALQIYCDFSGYSDMATAIALMMGFEFCKNFDSPYQSSSVTEFWRRWHISLSTWLRDYLYISLGGNRKGAFRTYLNQFITMLLGGLWHGSSLRFLLWGGMHGIALGVDKFIKSKIKIPDHIIIRLLGIFITFHFVCFCWIFFRASNMQIAGQVLTQIFTDFRAAQLPQFIAGYRNVILLMILGYALHFMPISIKEKAKALFIKTPFPLKALAVIAMIILVVQVKSSEIQPFIYFQF
jgi:D-alanyl-lipoteichoic acid acyltransferase DltB (MBOAT superfamily)